jgi:AcrR family transcriptional regulator
LEAARNSFAEHGYDRATIRGIAASAGVDPALVHHFYGTKEKLFVAATQFPRVPSEVLTEVFKSSDERLGEDLVRTLLRILETPEARVPVIGLLRSAMTNEGAARMLREFITDAILTLVTRRAKPDEAALRASLVASQIIGLGLTRFVLEIEPIASARVDDLAVAIGPTIHRYLTGDLRGDR